MSTIPPVHQLNDTPLPTSHFQRKYGVSRTSLWRWEQLGLRILHVAGKRFVRPSDWCAFIESQDARHRQEAQ
jgi:hypothetical protein